MSKRTRRTLQYAPAISKEKVQSAANSNADAVILDLESTVEEVDKQKARDNLSPLLNKIEFGDKEIVVRINGLKSTCWMADLSTAIEAGADTIRLPKIEEPWEIRAIVETANQLTTTELEFLIQLESPQGILNGYQIASTCQKLPQVTGIGVGIGDYTTALGRDDHTAELQVFLLNLTAAYAVIGNMDPLAYVHKDLESLRTAAQQAKALGHVGQPVSHKVQTEEFIAILNEVYST